MRKLAIVASHPIQYYAPLFEVLSKEIELKVFYCHKPTANEIGREGFGKDFEWDIDLLRGYKYEFLKNVSKYPSLTEYNGCNTPDLGNKIRLYGADKVVVFGWYLKSFKQALSYCRKHKIPIAIRGDSQLNPEQQYWKRWLKKIYYPFFLKKYDAFLCVGKRNEEYLKFYGVPGKKIIFSPHAVNQEFWRGERRNNKRFTFLWVGKFISKKRPFDVIKAFQAAYKEDVNIRLNMIGMGPLLDSCKALVDGDNGINFLGFKNQTELREEYLKANALILSSDFDETWGLVVNEAFASNLPAIVSSACGCGPDMMESGKTGYIYPYTDIFALQSFIIKMSSDFDGIKNKEFFSQINDKYSYKSNITSFKEFLNA